MFHLIFIIVAWAGVLGQYLSRAMATLFLSVFWAQVDVIFLALCVCLGVLMFEYWQFEEIKWQKITYFGILGALVAAQFLHPDSVYPILRNNGSITMAFSIELNVLLDVLIISFGLYIAYFFLKKYFPLSSSGIEIID